MSRRGWLGALGVIALALALRAPVATLPFERDEGEYAYTAQRWLAGDVPYRDVFDQKPPGVFAFYAAAFAIGGESPAAVRVAAQLWVAGGLVAIAALGARLFTPAIGLAAAGLGLVLCSDPSWLGNAVNTEQLATLPLALGALLSLGERRKSRIGGAALVGLLGGMALLLKPVTAPIVAFEIATLLTLAPRRLAHALAALLGLAVALLPTWLYFASRDAGAAFLDAVVWNNLAYAGQTKLSQYASYLGIQFAPTLVPLGPLYAAALAAPLALRASDAACRRRLAWLASWLAVSLVSVAAGGYFRQHYFALAMPPLALLAAVGLAAIARALLPAASVRRIAAPLAAGVLLAWSVGVGWWYYGPASAESKLQRLYGSNPFPEAPALGAWLASHSAPADRIFVYGAEPELLFYARRASASRYMFVYPLTMPLPAAATRQREALAEIDAARPRFVVGVFVRTSLLVQPGTPPELAAGLRERIERDYEVAAVVPFAADRRAKILASKPARALWNERPLWDGATPWAAFVVWERAEAGESPSQGPSP